MVVSQVAMLCLVVASGYLARKLKIMTDEIVAGISRLIMMITLPALVVSAFQRAYDASLLRALSQMLLLTAALHIACAALGYVVSRRLPDAPRKVLWSLCVFSNCGYMGYPLIISVLGADALIYAVVYNLGFNVALWTVGVGIFAGRMQPRRLLNPGLIASLLGGALFLWQIMLPAPVEQALELVGGLTTPLSMMIIGASMEGVRARDILRPLMGVGAALRLVLIPLAVYAALRLCGASGMVLSVGVLLAATPGAAATPMMAVNFGGDSALASRIVFFTTVLAVVTLPLISLLPGVLP